MARKNSDTIEIHPRIGKNLIYYIYGRKTYSNALKEIVKNSRDWGANSIQIDTSDKSRIKILDNGDGMSQANIEAFTSFSLSNATGPDQSGFFGTGSKYMLVSHASFLTVRTAPKSDPDKVYVFSFTVDDFVELVTEKSETLIVKKINKSKKTWPHPFKFGTELDYTFNNPKKSQIVRGEKLAERLARILPMKFENIVLVEGKKIPPKEVVGEVFSIIEQTRFGEIYIEVYKPKKASTDEGLFFGSMEVGEVPIANLITHINDYEEEIPAAFLDTAVCGTICSPFFKNYSTEHRTEFDREIANDQKLYLLFNILQKYAPIIEEKLQLNISNSNLNKEVKELIKEPINIINKIYSDGKDPDDVDGDKTKKPSSTSEQKAILLVLNRSEFSLGEEIIIDVIIKQGEKIEAKKLKWDTDFSLAKKIKKTTSGIKMIADKRGRGKVTVDVPGRAYTVSAYYEIVQERKFDLNARSLTVTKGSSITITAKNLDKLQGELSWLHKGVGTVDKYEKKIIFYGSDIGDAEIIAQDSLNADTTASCEVIVTKPRNTQLLCIKYNNKETGKEEVFWFHYQITYKPGGNLIQIILGKNIHMLYMNVDNPAFTEAVNSGSFSHIIIMSIAEEFSWFYHTEYQGLDIRTLDPADLPRFIDNIKVEGKNIFAEIMSKK